MKDQIVEKTSVFYFMSLSNVNLENLNKHSISTIRALKVFPFYLVPFQIFILSINFVSKMKLLAALYVDVTALNTSDCSCKIGRKH